MLEGVVTRQDGAGNPAGSSSGLYRGVNGTGGLLIIYSSSIENTSNIVSTGSSVTAGYHRGGGSGGGSINIFYKENYNNTGTINTAGGTGGATGGTGAISVGQIVNGMYTSTYKNY